MAESFTDSTKTKSNSHRQQPKTDTSKKLSKQLHNDKTAPESPELKKQTAGAELQRAM